MFAIVQRDGVEGFWFDEHWIRLVRNPVDALGRTKPVGFIAADLAKALEQRDANRVTRLLDPDQKGTHKVGTPSGEQEMAFVTEQGFYDVVIRSNKPQGRKLRRYVTDEILPQVLRTGRYAPEVEHQLDPAWQKARIRSIESRNTYTDAAKQCGAERRIGKYTNKHYEALTSYDAAGLQRTRGTGPSGPKAKDLLRTLELVANEALELGVVQQVHEHEASTLDDFHAIDTHMTWMVSTAFFGKLDIALPSKEKLAPQVNSSAYRTVTASDF